jgi:hypothetical protein
MVSVIVQHADLKVCPFAVTNTLTHWPRLSMAKAMSSRRNSTPFGSQTPSCPRPSLSCGSRYDPSSELSFFSKHRLLDISRLAFVLKKVWINDSQSLIGLHTDINDFPNAHQVELPPLSLVTYYVRIDSPRTTAVANVEVRGANAVPKFVCPPLPSYVMHSSAIFKVASGSSSDFTIENHHLLLSVDGGSGLLKSARLKADNIETQINLRFFSYGARADGDRTFVRVCVCCMCVPCKCVCVRIPCTCMHLS